jgi:hypothetical protein
MGRAIVLQTFCYSMGRAVVPQTFCNSMGRAVLLQTHAVVQWAVPFFYRNMS